MRDAVKKQTYDRERISWNTAWAKKYGHHFEVVVDPDKALAFRKSNGEGDVSECLSSEHVFFEAKQGQLASEEALTEAFGTTDQLEVAKRLILEGELQISAEHRAQIRDEKRQLILTKIHSYAIDPTTKLPHPRKRIELAMEEANVKIDDNKDVESQISDIVRKLQPIIPIRLEMVTLQIHLPAPFGQKLYGDLQRFGTLRKTDWLADGSLAVWVEVPAGLQNDLLSDLGGKTHGAVEFQRVEERKLEFQ